MARVTVNERILHWAVARSGRSPELVAKKFPIKDWLRGTKQPTLRQLEDFARYVRAPIGFFFLDEPPADDLSIPVFRTANGETPSAPSPELVDTVYAMRRRQAWVREYLIEQGYQPLPFVGKASIKDNPLHVADIMREVLGLPVGWAQQCASWKDALKHLQAAMDAAGIFVVVNRNVGNNNHRTLDLVEFRGFVLVDDYAPFVFVNGADVKAAQMFTLAHEMAHVLFGYSAAFDLRTLQPANDEVEKQCNRVAAEFLVPAHELRSAWPTVRHTEGRFQELARRFKVSEIVVARRLLDLGLIGHREFFHFYTEYEARDRTTQENRRRADFYLSQHLRVGTRFFTYVMNALHEGLITYTEAYRLTGLRGKTFHELSRRLTGGGAPS